MTKIKILFVNYDIAGVNYFRTQTPAVKLDQNHSDKFQVTIDPNMDFSPEGYATTIEYLKTFDIIHYHRTLHGEPYMMKKIANELKSAGVTLVADIDDYWELDKTHPMYHFSREGKTHLAIIDSLKQADYITTTTDLFAAEIKKTIPGAKVGVFPNSVDPATMPQFADRRKPDPNGLVRITYSAGSSHKHDVELLRGVVNILNADQETKGKFKIILAGWDTRGETTDVKFNEMFMKELQVRGLWTPKMVKSINASMGDVNKIEGIPNDLRVKYANQIFLQNKRQIRDTESVYYDYEKVFTDNYKLINDKEYVDFLQQIKQEPYPNEGNYGRRWTRKANVYAEVLNETDISLAPLVDHKFNRMKSNLKQVEVYTRRIPIVCSDVPPYNVDGKNWHNCVLIPNVKNSLPNKKLDQDWAKALKKLILNPELRQQLGNQLFEDFNEKYNLDHVTKNRAAFYEQIRSKATVTA
jgi:glycosyltransferase involved in cell wall biosynthesis